MKIGLSLGGGGAKGFAHLPILEVFDELGLRPGAISGVSIGAVLGALYASGMSAQQILVALLAFFPSAGQLLREIFQRSGSKHFLSLFDPNFKPGSFFKGERVLAFLYELLGTKDFADLQIPLKIVATDFWRREEVVFDSGDLLLAIRASMAIPHVFAPLVLEQRVLVDGGLCNNLPYEHLPPDCDITVAVDIAGDVSTPKNKLPSALEAIFYTYQVMMDAMSLQKMKYIPLDIHVRAPVLDIDMLEFHKAPETYRQGLAAKDSFREQLLQKLAAFEQRGGDLGNTSMTELRRRARAARELEHSQQVEAEPKPLSGFAFCQLRARLGGLGEHLEEQWERMLGKKPEEESLKGLKRMVEKRAKPSQDRSQIKQDQAKQIAKESEGLKFLEQLRRHLPENLLERFYQSLKIKAPPKK